MEQEVLTQTTTKEIVIGKMNLALTKATLGIQMLHDLESHLVYNEDNIESISDFLTKARKAKKIIETEHKDIKEPYLKECQTIDESKREMLSLVEGVLNTSTAKYTTLCQEIENRKRLAEQERQRKINIQSGIDSNMISFSGRIAGCTTNEELISIERLINLEKANKSKYQEFHEQAVEKYESLTALIKSQKENIKEAIRLEKERLDAEKKGDEEKLIALQEQQEKLTEKTDELKITVQESAINSSLNTVVETATEILPEVKVRRSSWDFEVVDIHTVVKKMPSWTKIELVEDKIKEFIKASKDSWNDEGGEERIINGIKFFIRKTY
jgi:hypothetical protein